jgi:hypothetical protein
MTVATKVPAAPKRQREAPPSLEETPQNLEKTPPQDTETLNFKVASEFKREYKVYAASRGMTMIDLLEQSYQIYKERHGS